MTTPVATYRLQFRSGMDFGRAAELVAYMKALGVSHLYASPIFQATPGSAHGYDVTDYGALDSALDDVITSGDLAAAWQRWFPRIAVPVL